MTIDITTTPYGSRAHDALAAAIDRHKATDRLAPVSVVVSSNQVGIAARRALGRRRGVAAVTFLTPYRLAELLGAGAVAAGGRRPVSTPVLAGAVRAVLAEDPGHFTGVEQHPATERALVRVHRALSEVGPSGLDRLATQSTRTADVVRIHRAVRRRIRERFSDEHDLVEAAVATIPGIPPVLRDLGPTIVFLPQRLSSNQARLLAVLGEHHPITLIAGVTGDTEADAAVRRSATMVGATWPGTMALPTAVAARALSVSDADDEVRHAVRHVVDATRSGTPLERIAILYGTRDPYARLLADALDAAEIDWFGASVRTADTSLLGRSLLALLALPDHDLSRHDVAAWLAGAPIRGNDNRPAPVAAWERVSRAAGVVAGIDQWQHRLTRLADDLDSDADTAERDPELEWRAARLRGNAESARSLAAFVAGLDAALTPGGRGRTWSGLASWCRSLVRTYLGGERLRTDWPVEEQAAAQRVDAAIDRLGDLDGIDPDPSPAAFRRALELQLADDLGRHGTFGHGLLVGPVSLGLGVELDEVIVVGMAEGSFPARRRNDPLLPDRVRVTVGPDLPQRADLVHDDHRALLAVVAAAERTTYTFPRGDLRRNAARSPSRWLLDATEHHDGVRPSAEELDALTGQWLREVPSFVAGLRASDFPATVTEYDLRSLLDHVEAGNRFSLDLVPSDRPAVRRSAELLTARLSAAYTRFDGNLATDGDLRGVTIPHPRTPGHVTSATRLEAWASCPHAYFVRHILGVGPVEDPEEQYRLSPLVRGSLVHDTLDRWIAEAMADGAVPAPGQPWPQRSVERLHEIADEEAGKLERRGLVGRRVYWGHDKQVIHRDLEIFARFDDRQRAAYGSTPIATELPFGMPGSITPPVGVELPDGGSITIRGAIDRVDRTSGDGVLVIDYKTGSQRGYKGLSPENPTPGGTHLQLVLYALAARSILGTHASGEHGTYWFVTDRGEFEAVGYDVDPSIEHTALTTVERIADGIAAGHFPARPAKPTTRRWVHCIFCEPDGLGLGHQDADWRRKHTQPDLADYVDLVGDDRG